MRKVAGRGTIELHDGVDAFVIRPVLTGTAA